MRQQHSRQWWKPSTWRPLRQQNWKQLVQQRQQLAQPRRQCQLPMPPRPAWLLWLLPALPRQPRQLRLQRALWQRPTQLSALPPRLRLPRGPRPLCPAVRLLSRRLSALLPWWLLPHRRRSLRQRRLLRRRRCLQPRLPRALPPRLACRLRWCLQHRAPPSRPLLPWSLLRSASLPSRRRWRACVLLSAQLWRRVAAAMLPSLRRRLLRLSLPVRQPARLPTLLAPLLRRRLPARLLSACRWPTRLPRLFSSALLRLALPSWLPALRHRPARLTTALHLQRWRSVPPWRLRRPRLLLQLQVRCAVRWHCLPTA